LQSNVSASTDLKNNLGLVMKKLQKYFWLIALPLLINSHARASELSSIDNYLEYSSVFSSSGQPGAEQLKVVADAGFKRVIYLAFTNSKTAIDAEDSVVKALGMDYIHIPVDFKNPRVENFEDFALLMERNKSIKTLLHCQVNMRASSFSFLYRVIYSGVPIFEAKRDLDAIWQPNKVWYTFIVDVLNKHGYSHLCDDCDWGENEFD